jgi:hypothetical protein
MAVTMWCAERLYLLAMGDEPATDAEISRWIDECRPRRGQQVRALVDAGNSNLSPTQRKAIADMAVELRLDYRAAVLTDSILTRGVVTALSWLGATQRAFAPADLAGALLYLELSGTEMEQALRELPRLRVESKVLEAG